MTEHHSEAFTFLDPVEHGEGVVGGERRDVQVVDGGLLLGQCRQLMEVGGKQAEGAQLGGYVVRDGPGQAKAIVGGRSPAQLINDNERVLCGRAEEEKVGKIEEFFFFT